MVVLFVIILCTVCIIVALNNGSNPDKSGLHFDDASKIEEYKRNLSQLESCYYKCKELSNSEKALNLWPSDSSLLESFNFSNGHVSLRMKDGKTISGDILNMSARFSVLNGDNVVCKLTCGSVELEFKTIWHLFSDEEWYDIMNCLTWCGTTYNVNAYISVYNKNNTASGKAIKYANVLLKGIRIIQNVS